MPRRRKSAEEKEYDVLLANVREVCKTSHGKDVIWHILAMCRIADDCFTNDNATFYNEGQRSIGLQVMQLLDDADLSIYPRLLLEKRKIDLNGGQNDGTDNTTDDTGASGATIDSDTGVVPDAK